jgi:hypothetical protein
LTNEKAVIWALRQNEGLSYKKADKKYAEGFKMTQEESIKQRCHEILNRLEISSSKAADQKPEETKETDADDSFGDIDIRPTELDYFGQDAEHTYTEEIQDEIRHVIDEEQLNGKN